VSKCEEKYELKQKQKQELERFQERFFPTLSFELKYGETKIKDDGRVIGVLERRAINSLPFIALKAEVDIEIAENERELKIYNSLIEDAEGIEFKRRVFSFEENSGEGFFKKMKQKFSDISLFLAEFLSEQYGMKRVISHYNKQDFWEAHTLICQDDTDRIEIAYTRERIVH